MKRGRAVRRSTRLSTVSMVTAASVEDSDDLPEEGPRSGRAGRRAKRETANPSLFRAARQRSGLG